MTGAPIYMLTNKDDVPTIMDDVSVFVDHDVSVVSVFDLQQITHQVVGSHALDKVDSGLAGQRKI